MHQQMINKTPLSTVLGMLQCYFVCHGNSIGRSEMKKFLLLLVSLFMTLTLINKYILNPFNVLYFITFKFIYFFTLQYAFVLIQFRRTPLQKYEWVVMNSGWARQQNFKTTCHGLFWCDVTAIHKNYLLSPGKGRNETKSI